jgi:hypothetical protein
MLTPANPPVQRLDHWHPFAEKFPLLDGEEWEGGRHS